jgi:hypothetical protein
VTKRESAAVFRAEPGSAACDENGLDRYRDLFCSGDGARIGDDELLALLVGPVDPRPGGMAALLGPGGLESLLGPIAPAPWWRGLPPGPGLRLAAAVELSHRLAAFDLRFRRREHFVGLYLNARNRMLARRTVSVGSLNASIVHPREVFAPALRLGAAGLIVVHNHPSGETDPSVEDLELSRRLSEAGEILGIDLLDHVIVGSGGFTSLKESGQL